MTGDGRGPTRAAPLRTPCDSGAAVTAETEEPATGSPADEDVAGAPAAPADATDHPQLEHRDVARTTLHHAPSAAGAARRFVRNHLCPVHAAGALDAVQLIVSELVTNAVEHGRPPVVLTLLCNADLVTIGVHDASDDEPRASGAEVPWHSESGRGMQLVEGLTVHWGVRSGGPRGGAGKGVWASLVLDELP